MKDNTNSPVGAQQEFNDTQFNSQEFHENSNPKIENGDTEFIKELVAKLEAKHEELHESERARIKLLEEKNELQAEMISMLKNQ